MKAKTELLLYQMLWGADKLLRPTLRNLDESFESWTYRNGYQWQVARLEAAGCVEVGQTAFDEAKVCRLTEAGRLAALGGRDPEEEWDRAWDGKWRMFLFDIPERSRSVRRQLTRSLASMGCGCLQGSVWISARPLPEDAALQEDGEDCAHLVMLDAESRGLPVDRGMAEAAWDFEKLNQLYDAHLLVMKRMPNRKPGLEALATWAREENEAWLRAVRADPLLPEVLLPKKYQGQRNWRMRKSLLGKAGRVAEAAMEASAADEVLEQ